MLLCCSGNSRYIYCGSVELTDENVFPVLYLAKKYLVKGLVDMCQERIQLLNPTPTTIIELIAQAQRCASVPQKYALNLLQAYQSIDLPIVNGSSQIVGHSRRDR